MSKFDQFIEDFDKSLNKDTSKLSTLSCPSSPTEFNLSQMQISPSRESTQIPPVAPTTPNPQHESITRPQQQSTPTKPCKNSVSLHPLSPMNVNTSSRKKGLNLNITMSQSSTPNRQPKQQPIRNRSDSSSTVGSIGSDDEMSEILRKMASSEMKIIELKDEVKLIQAKIAKEEEDLNKLRNKVVQNLNQVKTGSPFKQRQQIDNNQNITNGQGYWIKPLTILNQFDQMLQNEFEKLNKESSQDKEDVLKGVSNSLWSFVSDVKTGLMGDEDKVYKKKQEKEQKEEKEEELIDFGEVRQDG